MGACYLHMPSYDMNKQILGFLNKHFPKEPHLINRLFVSAYLKLNRIVVEKNRLISSHIIKYSQRDESEYLEKFIVQLNKNGITLNLESLISLFEFVVSPEDRVINGAIYTPAEIRNFIVVSSLAGRTVNTVKVADIACGCGGFLLTASKAIKTRTSKSYYTIFRDQIFGLDIQTYSAVRTKILLSLLAIEAGEDREDFIFNVFVGDALEFDWSKKVSDYVGFNIIVGNPPYVCSRNIAASSRELLSNWSVCSSGHPDLYIPFFQIGLENIKKDGFLGFITMNSFFKSLNGRALRQYFLDNSFSFKIVDFGNNQIFKSRSTYTCICLIQNFPGDHIEYRKATSIEDLDLTTKYHQIAYNTLNSIDGWNLSLNNSLLSKIEGVGQPFSKKYKTRNGIATLKNDVYIFKPTSSDERYYYLFDNGNEYPIEKEICRSIINPNLLVNEIAIKKIVQKIIFPYIVEDNKISAVDEKTFIENFPYAYSYLKSKKPLLAKRDKGGGR